MLARIIRLMAFLVVSVSLTGCATTSLVDTWRNTGLSNQKQQKLLVVYIGKNESVSRVFEDVLVNELKQNGIAAEPGHMFIPGGEKVMRPTLEKGIKESGADGLITIQKIMIEQRINVEPGYGLIYPGYWYPTAFPNWDMYGYFYAYPYYEPSDIYTYEIGKIQVNLFDAKSSKLEWAGTIETYKPGDVVTVAKELSRIIVPKLKEEGLI